VSHFFGAIKIAAFRDPDAFRKDMDIMLKRLRACPPAKGVKEVYFAGQKEYEAEKLADKLGVPLTMKTYDSLKKIGLELGIRLKHKTVK
jgi:LDH2 family malate/lactate/ureidoglycolate dehydrogenase